MTERTVSADDKVTLADGRTFHVWRDELAQRVVMTIRSHGTAGPLVAIRFRDWPIVAAMLTKHAKV